MNIPGGACNLHTFSVLLHDALKIIAFYQSFILNTRFLVWFKTIFFSCYSKILTKEIYLGECRKINHHSGMQMLPRFFHHQCAICLFKMDYQ